MAKPDPEKLERTEHYMTLLYESKKRQLNLIEDEKKWIYLTIYGDENKKRHYNTQLEATRKSIADTRKTIRTHRENAENEYPDGIIRFWNPTWKEFFAPLSEGKV